MRNGELYLVLTDVRIPTVDTNKYTIFASKTGYMHSRCYNKYMLLKNQVCEVGNSAWDIMEVYKRVYSKDADFIRNEPHRGPVSIESSLDPENLYRIWSREEEFNHVEIEQDDTIKESDEFSSKEITFC